jgi:hypothetical protein
MVYLTKWVFRQRYFEHEILNSCAHKYQFQNMYFQVEFPKQVVQLLSFFPYIYIS